MPTEDKQTVIVDLDGTLADNTHRQHWLDTNQHKGMTADERWRVFFGLCGSDSPKSKVIEIVKIFKSAGHPIWIFSGRSDEVKLETVRWLSYYTVPYDKLVMRQKDDHRCDTEVKRAMIAPYSKNQFLCVLDDRDTVVAMWRELGLLCLQVEKGSF